MITFGSHLKWRELKFNIDNPYDFIMAFNAAFAVVLGVGLWLFWRWINK